VSILPPKKSFPPFTREWLEEVAKNEPDCDITAGVHMIDWTKPVEFTDGTPVRVERVLADGTAILSWVSSGEVVQAAVCSPFNTTMRNETSLAGEGAR
jgi:hypothetical protein